MMAPAPAPGHIDIRSKLLDSNFNFSSSLRGFLSPRTHLAGEIPPDLSPLDAFAAQSRLLAQQLEEGSHGDNCITRLRPRVSTNSLSQEQLGDFAPVSFKSTDERPLSPASLSLLGVRTKIESPGYRHMSIHPTVYEPSEGDYFGTAGASLSTPIETDKYKKRESTPPSSEESEIYFNTKLQQSPPSPSENPFPPKSATGVHKTQNPLNHELHRHTKKLSGTESNNLENNSTMSLAPNYHPFAQRTPSPHSFCTESSDDDNSLSIKRSLPLDQNIPVQGNISNPMPSSRLSGRTSSIGSDTSFTAIRLSNRPSTFNFSRPLARTSLPNELPIGEVSSDSSRFSSIPTDEIEYAPLSTHSEAFPDLSVESNQAPAYVYAKYALPRGKTLKRNSVIFQSPSSAQHSFQPSIHYDSAPSSPLARATNSTSGQKSSSAFRRNHSPPFEPLRPSRSSSASSQPFIEPIIMSPENCHISRESITRPNTTSLESPTPKAKSQVSLALIKDLSATEHVEKAIEHHQAGALSKSTYHLRLAARMSHPTGMLLYALACRHGWGMRPNQREGVAWLRKAVDEAGLEVADDETMIQAGKPVDVMQMKNKKAQFALSIYELGVSHMNGWGIEQDKALGLRCFEIAGSWGDADAMAEAGFCYAQGVGCKKNLNKSASFYRMAEARGINMIGNSWIYKAKYNDSKKDEKSNGRGRSSTSSSKDAIKSMDNHKSRSRGIFRRSKIPQTRED